MAPEFDDIPDRLGRVIETYIGRGQAAALLELEPVAFHPYEAAARPALPLAVRISVLKRDGWLCRYCGKRTIFQPVMALLGSIFSNDFPHHTNWCKCR